MSYTSITRYIRADILINRNDVEIKGYPKEKTEGEMIDLAILHGCKIIVKSGKNAKWYLKGKGRTIEVLKRMIANAVDSGKYNEHVFCLLVE